MTRKKTGPKPKTFTELVQKNAQRNNCKFIKGSDSKRKALVKCLDCSQTRVTKDTYRFPMCVCKLKRKFYMRERTVETHNEELADKGYVGMFTALTRLGKNVFRYRHAECGREFESHTDYLGCSTVRHFCTECRRDALDRNKVSAQDIKQRLKAKAPHLRLIAKDFVPGVSKKFKVHNAECGHSYDILMYRIEHRKSAHGLRCPVCHPTSVWFEFELAGKEFKTRSLVEKKFMEFLVHDLGVSVDDIQYEPKDYRVDYTCPVSRKRKTYIPDFRVKGVLVEVKDINSLGVGAHYYWQPNEEALIVNRAKCVAARKNFGDYRIYVLCKSGRFRKANDFWKPREQKRLLSL